MNFRDAVNAVLDSKDVNAHADAITSDKLLARIEKAGDCLRFSGTDIDGLDIWDYLLFETPPITFDEAMKELLINKKNVKNVNWRDAIYLTPNAVGGFDFSEAADIEKIVASETKEDWMIVE